jgi:sugar O-acyltransferase (sialic acid O-acetyltransferase NeuD family)
MTEIVIFGNGSFAELAYHYMETDSEYEIVAFSADEEYINKGTLFDLPVVPFNEVYERYPPDEYDMFVAITYTDLNHLRTEKYHQATDLGYNLVSYVSSDSVVSDKVTIGDNCFIFENQTIQPFVDIGDNVILWSGNHIGHHSTIHDNCFLASHVVVSGHVEIDEFCFLGVNSTVADGVTVAEHTLVGAQALIAADTVNNGVYTGPKATLKDTNSREVL